MGKSKTAMQQAIDLLNNEAHKYFPNADERNALQSFLPKLVKLRDTVEKQQRKNDWINGWNQGNWDSCNDPNTNPIKALERYNETYGNENT